MKIVRFKQWECEVQFGLYPNGRTAIMLNDINSGIPIAVSSVNLPEMVLDKNDVLIKNYSENEGMKKVLMEAGIISEEIISQNNRLNISLHKLL